MPGTVSDVSATLVASTMRRARDDGLNTRSCSSAERRAEQRQNFGGGGMMLAQRLGGFADLALAGQEHQHVAATGTRTFVDCVDDRIHQRAVVGVVLALRVDSGR